MTSAETTTWWTSLYDNDLAAMLLERHDAEQTALTLNFIIDRLAVAEGALLFDQCCGIGSLSLPLARRGYRLVGVDQADVYIERANRNAVVSDLSATFETDDAFEFVSPEPCDGAFNWWTSFGYAETDDENLKMLQRAFESLRPGASFMLDTMNVPGMLRGFRPDVVTERSGVTLWRVSTLDLAGGRLRKTWTYLLPDGERRVHETSVRLYMPHNLVELFGRAGFVDMDLVGSVAGEAYVVDSPRCICVARRPL